MELKNRKAPSVAYNCNQISVYVIIVIFIVVRNSGQILTPIYNTHLSAFVVI